MDDAQLMHFKQKTIHSLGHQIYSYFSETQT